MSLTTTEAYRLLVSCWPQGSESHYDLSPTGDIGKFLLAQAAFVADRQGDIDTLRLELNPATMTQKIADWETACGLSQTKIARFGTTAQRRAQVLAVLRSFGSSFSLPEIQAIAQPFLGYTDPSLIQILETDRATLTALHTQTDSTGYVLAMGAPDSAVAHLSFSDDANVSPSGAQCSIVITGDLQGLDFDLFSPSGKHKTWAKGYLGTGSVVAQTYYLYAPEMAGGPIAGNWTLVVTNDGVAACTVGDMAIFAEGLGRDSASNDGLGAAMYEWAVVADPTRMSATADLEGLYQVLQIIKPAHTTANVVKMNSFGLEAIPDEPETIPSACIPGT